MTTMTKITEDAVAQLSGSLVEGKEKEAATIIEAAIIRAILEGDRRSIIPPDEASESEQDKAHKLRNQSRRKTDALISNLSGFASSS